ncbi:MAG: outer membrane protein assembly factor BamD [Hyphomicrobiales bacterium]|nr:outer membrane protein assembly factor BamD [Hyphomicrobiales bacterium]
MQSAFQRIYALVSADRRRSAVLAVAACLPLAGCSGLEGVTSPFSGLFGGEKYQTKLLKDTPADQLYDTGLVRLQKHDYDGAGKDFGELEKQYPNSNWSQKGLLMQTYSQYTEGKYDDAVATANHYIGLYPSAKDTPYVYYLAGMSYYNQIPEADKDQERAEKALIVFSQLVEKFPKSEYVADAKYKIQVAKDQLAGREMKVGRFYLQSANYTAAINRFREVLAKYQSTRHTEEALYRLVEAYLKLGVVNEAQTAAAVLGHNFPDSQWYKDAYALLKTGNLEPQESQDSWISKAFRKTVG